MYVCDSTEQRDLAQTADEIRNETQTEERDPEQVVGAPGPMAGQIDDRRIGRRRYARSRYRYKVAVARLGEVALRTRQPSVYPQTDARHAARGDLTTVSCVHGTADAPCSSSS